MTAVSVNQPRILTSAGDGAAAIALGVIAGG